MPQARRAGTRTVLLAAALVVGLSSMLAIAVWASAQGTPTGRVGTAPAQTPAPFAADLPPLRGGSVPVAPTSAGVAQQLHTMDLKSLDKAVASEEAAVRQASSPSRVAGGTWLIGEVGAYLVGRRATPGTYESAAPAAGKTCRWAVADINGNTLRSGSSRTRTSVVIRKTDGFFQTTGCANWHKIS